MPYLDEQAGHEPLRWLLTLSLPAQDVDAVLEFRTVLESGLARLAAERISDEALARLRGLLAELEAAESDEEVLRADMKMHAVIAEEANNPMLLWMLNAAVELNVAARSRTVRVPGVKGNVAVDQRAIVEALERRDGNEAAEAMWRHLKRISTRLQRVFAAALQAGSAGSVGSGLDPVLKFHGAGADRAQEVPRAAGATWG